MSRHIHLQPAYVLHHRPYRDTSRIVELFTRDHGRVTVFARAARGGKGRNASLMSMVQPFNRLLVSWSAGAEAGSLTAAEFDGAYAPLPPDRLLSGCYLNELLMKLFARSDTHAEVFELYLATIEALKHEPDPVPTLRIFEKRLLDALGYGLSLRYETQGSPIEPDRRYHYRLEQGAVRALDVAEGPLVFAGVSLLGLAREELHDTGVRQDARRLLKAALDRILDGRELKSREVLMALRRQK